MELVLSKENISVVAKDLKTEDGYDLKHKLYKSLMQLMSKYEIPYEIAESYTSRIIYAVLEQLRTICPQKYEHYFLQEWRDEQETSFLALQKRIDKMSDLLQIEESYVRNDIIEEKTVSALETLDCLYNKKVELLINGDEIYLKTLEH